MNRPTTIENKALAITKAICNKGFNGNSNIQHRSNFGVGGQERSPQSLTAYSLDRCKQALKSVDHQNTHIMIRKFEIILISLMVIFPIPGYCQFIDNYGIKSGIGITSEYWKLKMPDPIPSDWRIDKIGPICQIFLEKHIGKMISLRPELGYIQRGFTDESNFLDENEEYIPIKNNHVVFHYISTDFVIVITPIHRQIKPYLVGGMRSDYFIGYRDIVFYDKSIGTYNSYGDYKKFTFGVVFGIGVNCCGILSFEFEYNPSITNNYSDDFLDTRGRLFGITMAVNINQLIIRGKS